jgi:hypothetical protein
MVAVIAPYSILNERKIANALIEHGTQHLSVAYNHALYLEPRAKMMRDWADFLELTQRRVKVTPIRERRA